MYRFFVEKEQIDREQRSIRIMNGDVNHIRNVLRMKQGEKVLISDGGDEEYLCCVEQLSQEQVLLHIDDIMKADRELPSRIYLFQGLPKSDKMELIIQKAVELGAYEIIPVETRRCVAKLDARKQESKIRRWQGIAESAAKQSKRMIIPRIHPVMKYSQALRYAQEMDIRIIPYELAEDMEHTRNYLSQIQPGQSVAVFIGPEGGFAPEEIEEALQNQTEPVTLGKRILRTETAGLTILSVLMVLLEGK
ncbi:MAG: 16S rRNA (uracil(1498)-N(3))-methyltransferase [Oliverpabstia sp.]